MTKFTIETLEYWRQTYEVDADNLDEALDIIEEGGGVEIGKPEFVQRDDAEFWLYCGECIGDLPVDPKEIVE